MAEFAIFATAEIAASRMDEVLPPLLAHGRRCLSEEPGTLQFDVLKPLNGGNKVFFYEVYADEAAFQTHWIGPLVARAKAETDGMIIKLSGERCSVQE